MELIKTTEQLNNPLPINNKLFHDFCGLPPLHSKLEWIYGAIASQGIGTDIPNT